jgi:acetyl/propionyl-CoA carboxylase alpha subunit
MIRSLLIANRGEIARRIIRTARRMEIATVAVYSEADRHAAHVRDADRAVVIGPAEARDSYLNNDAILAAARESGAEAVHPGYGFLSENAAFAEAVTEAGLIWIGPPPAAIRAMGAKDEAKRLAAAAGVPVTPGYLGEDQSEGALEREAAAIGYPILIKAIAGGGGKGMRKVESRQAFAAALASARREAKAAFGDDRVFLEKLIATPRHIEVQIFADSRGNTIHLFERDCSLQRRHQKVIEEAPAPGMDEATREAICSAAIRAARAVGYVGAGTVEFIADARQGLRADRIWFMEMNTRLQVEHPVTEAITGLDLVEWQIRVAAGEALPLEQTQIRRHGHAIEARLYAEDPANGFLPSPGILRHLRLPDSVRVDSGVEEGDAVPRFYDPMIAKLIAHAPTRKEAAATLARACRAVEAWPVKTNAAFLAACLEDEAFRTGHVNTGFIDLHLEALTATLAPDAAVLHAAAEVALLRRGHAASPREKTSPWQALTGFRLNAPAAPVTTHLRHGETDYAVVLPPPIPGATSPDAHAFGPSIVVFDGGNAYEFASPGASESATGESGDGLLRAPMPGTVVAVAVAAGATVTRGQTLLVLEAMKMEFPMTAPFDGRVVEISAPGRQVSEGTLLARLERTPR